MRLFDLVKHFDQRGSRWFRIKEGLRLLFSVACNGTSRKVAGQLTESPVSGSYCMRAW